MNKQLAIEITQELVFMMEEIRDNPYGPYNAFEDAYTPIEERQLTRDMVSLLMRIREEE